MKTKTNTIKNVLRFIAVPIILIFTVVSVGAFGSSGNPSPSPKPNCSTFHNNGYTGAIGGSGTSFATFNGFIDQETEDGRPFDERQFMYIEIDHADGNGQFPRQGGTDYTPWANISNYNFNAPQATNYNFNFGTNPNERYYVGFWGYMHNNGTADQYEAHDVKMRLTGFSPNTPQTSHHPKYTVSADDTCPLNVWADVTVSGNRGFTMNLEELYLFRESNTGPYEIVNASNNSAAKQNITSNVGLGINSNSNYVTDSDPRTRFDSSEQHYVLVYTEFEIVPEQPGECRSLNITDPSQVLINVNENGFNDRNLSYSVDADDEAVSTYRVFSGDGTITFDNSGQSDIERNKTQMVMDGGPDANTQMETVQVWALDQNGLPIPQCMDSFSVIFEPDEEEVECANLDTTPGDASGPVPLNQNVPINIDELINTDGQPYTDNGQVPTVKYCYSNHDILFYSTNGNHILSDVGNQRCVYAKADNQVSFWATSEGTMDIEVVGAEAVCNSGFVTEDEGVEGECLLLEFRDDLHDEFNVFERSEYCVTLDYESTVIGYDDDIRWTVERPGQTAPEFSEVTTNTLCLDFDDYTNQYSFLPGDVLRAEAIGIDDPNNLCDDVLPGIDEEVCEYFDIDKDWFERGRNNKICVDTNWPIQSTGVWAAEPGDNPELLDVDDDDCFILTENFVSDANIIEVWVPGWEEDCFAELHRKVNPPDFEKESSTKEITGFSSRTIANSSDTYVYYQVTYNQKDEAPQDVEITDTIGLEGFIQGYIADPDKDSYDPDFDELGGRIYYDDNYGTSVWVEGEGEIPECSELSSIEDEVCYDGDIGSVGGVLVRNAPERKDVVVSYRGRIESTVTPENCSDPNHILYNSGYCGEVYPNTSYFDDELFNGEDDARVIIPCPFLIIRSGGEVFLENPFDYGIDTLSCSEFENVPVPLITPDLPPGDIPKTGEGVTLLQTFNERLCQSEKASAIPGYEDIERFSSLVCEITLDPSGLTQFAIAQDINRTIQLSARYDKNLLGTSILNGSSTLDTINSTSEVYVKNDGDLRISGKFSDGAQTIVVIGHDVIIDGNITYDDPATLTDPRTVPSIAVIVIGGDIIVEPNVTQTNGVFYVQEDEEGNGGQMCENACVEGVEYNGSQFIHNGSIYGDIEHLFKYRTFAGDPSKQEAAILIRFDSRVYLNTPPLLNQLVNVTQEVF
ncbi:hypothetical protein ACFL10_02065 [Patescibacteria group bacterium]